MGFPGGIVVKNLPANAGEEDPLEGEWQPTPAFMPGKFCGWRSLADYSPQGHKESETTEQLSTKT